MVEVNRTDLPGRPKGGQDAYTSPFRLPSYTAVRGAWNKSRGALLFCGWSKILILQSTNVLLTPGIYEMKELVAILSSFQEYVHSSAIEEYEGEKREPTSSKFLTFLVMWLRNNRPAALTVPLVERCLEREGEGEERVSSKIGKNLKFSGPFAVSHLYGF